jgi:tetratricopeptide (TPR) repeat protein
MRQGVLRVRKKIRFDPVAFAIIVLAAFALYGSALSHPFLFDDLRSIVENPYIRNLRNVPLLLQGIQSYTGPYRALPTITFAVNYHFHQLNVFGYHLVNLILHILCGILVYLISRHLFGLASKTEEASPNGKQEVRNRTDNIFPLLTALIFVIHPIQVNTVTYIIGRNEGMAGFFFLLTFFLFIKGSFQQGRKKAIFWSGAGFSFLGSVLSKEIGFMLPIVLILFDLIFVCQTREETMKRWKIYFPVFLILTLYGLFFLKGGAWGLLIKGSPGWQWSSLPEHLLTEANVIIQYFKLIFIPLPKWLNIDHDVKISKTLMEYPTWISVSVHLGLLVLAAFCFRKRKLISFSIGWFYLILAPTSSIIPIWDVMVEYRLYLPLFVYGLLLALSIKNLSQFLGGKGSKRFGRSLVWGLVILMLCFYSWATLERNKVLKDDLSLWTDASKKSPDKYRAKLSLVNAYLRHGLYDRAIEESLVLLKKDPNDYEVYNTMGISHMKKKEYDQAIDSFQKSIRINSKSVFANTNLGELLLEQKKFDQAVETFEKALQALPGYAKAYNNLANALAMKGLLDEAIQKEKEAIRIDPVTAEFRYNLARFYEDQNRVAEAIQAYQEALRLDSGLFPALLSLGMLYSRIENFPEAIRELEKARRIKPNSGKVHFMLGVNYFRKKEIDKAIESLERALPLAADEKDRKEIESFLNRVRSRL